MKQNEQLSAEFSDKLNAMVLALRDRALRQFNYNLEHNVPAGRMDLDQVVDQALRCGVASAVNTTFHWDCDNAIRTAYAILEDANCHDENRALAAVAKKHGIDL